MDTQYRSCLAACRQERDTIAGKAFLALLRERAAAARERLVRAAPEQVARLQGAVLALEDIVRDIESDAQAVNGPDGGYA
ncbi:hypothetical protein PCS_00031 [Desulfocurvibacter africanus PCS]|uniref:Uncharacterized protein n=1 Tax=Desulfocurvibacter africanus PCS TaxID=1262666 RepID=M5PYN5_DESAF|nr:hypothetical protein [Desulfocurvibacter africanus]EMG39145.1 hypothetical protein PCS_00031 [Desulfocurvibacter africanus PCS]